MLIDRKVIMFSPVTRLSGLLSVNVVVERNRVIEANASGTLFRGFEWIMQDRHVTDAVYLTQRVCGICSMAHGACASYLLDELYDNEINDNAQYLRNIMYGAEFLQNHVRHFYLFSLPDFVQMPDLPMFQNQNLQDARLSLRQNQRLAEHYFEAMKAAQESHQILALFGGKAPHQHSFLHGGVSVSPSADKIGQALALIGRIREFIDTRLIPDTELLSRVYADYFQIGLTPGRLLSFGLFRFGRKNEEFLWRPGVLLHGKLSLPDVQKIEESVARSWFDEVPGPEPGQEALEPNPLKPGAYSWVKSATYDGKPFEGGPLARMIINGFYSGKTSTMDRICARSIETSRVAALVKDWLERLVPGPPPIDQKQVPVKTRVIAVTDAMRGPLLHSVETSQEKVLEYNIITPTVWNFSPKNSMGEMGPVESALVGTRVGDGSQVLTVLGRIIRSFDPCLACGTHVLHKENGQVMSGILDFQ